jgi:hypothetical protein
VEWVVLSYSLPAQERSSARVALWRRLRRLGALTLAGSVHLLPGREECVEAFQWFAQEVRQVNGEALVMCVGQFEGLTDADLVELFRSARAAEYQEIMAQAAALQQTLQSAQPVEDRERLLDALDKLRRRHAEVARIDYFDAPEGVVTAAQLAALAQALLGNDTTQVAIAPAQLARYRQRTWVTRPRPHVDRLACAWLIRRFVEPEAVIRYASEPAPGEVTFDMPGAEFGHQGNLCSFETMLRAFGLDDPGLQAIAEMVHEIDLRDGRYVRPDIAGVDALLRGWLLVDYSDTEREAHGIALFEGLYAAYLHQGTIDSPDIQSI